MVDRAATVVAQDDRHRRTPHRLSDCARRGASGRATSTRPSRNSPRAGSRCASSTTRRSPRSILRASASAASTRPRWRAPAIGRAAPRKPPAAPRRRAPPTPALPSNRPAITASWRAQNSALPQIELNGVPRGRARVERLEIVRAVQLLYELDEREIAIPILADMGENGDPDALVGLGELAARYSDARGMLLMGKAALNRGLPFDFLRLSGQRHPAHSSRSGRKSSRASSTPSRGRKAPSIRRWSRRRRPTG